MSIVKYRVICFEIDVFGKGKRMKREIVANAIIAEYDNIEDAKNSLRKYKCSIIPLCKSYWNGIKYQIEKHTIFGIGEDGREERKSEIIEVAEWED